MQANMAQMEPMDKPDAQTKWSPDENVQYRKSLPPEAHEHHREARGVRGITMMVAFPAGRAGGGNGGGASKGISKGLRMCFAGLISSVLGSDAAGVGCAVLCHSEVKQDQGYQGHLISALIMVVVTLVVIVIFQGLWIGKLTGKPEPVISNYQHKNPRPPFH